MEIKKKKNLFNTVSSNVMLSRTEKLGNFCRQIMTVSLALKKKIKKCLVDHLIGLTSRKVFTLGNIHECLDDHV